MEYNINDTKRTKLSDFKTNLMVTTGKNHCGERGIGSVGITYTHYCIKEMINENLRSTGKSTQKFVITIMGKKNGYRYMYN